MGTEYAEVGDGKRRFGIGLLEHHPQALARAGVRRVAYGVAQGALEAPRTANSNDTPSYPSGHLDPISYLPRNFHICLSAYIPYTSQLALRSPRPDLVPASQLPHLPLRLYHTRTPLCSPQAPSTLHLVPASQLPHLPLRLLYHTPLCSPLRPPRPYTLYLPRNFHICLSAYYTTHPSGCGDVRGSHDELVRGSIRAACGGSQRVGRVPAAHAHEGHSLRWRARGTETSPGTAVEVGRNAARRPHFRTHLQGAFKARPERRAHAR